MARTIGYVALHYGSDFLGYAIQAVSAQVDEVHVLYTPSPSYGYGTDLHCPDTEENLQAIANLAAPEKIRWHRGIWGNEGEHRNTIFQKIGVMGPEDILVVFDADEVWPEESLQKALAEIRKRPEQKFLVNFVHFWKSFGWVCRDCFRPIRLIKPAGQGDAYLDLASPILHFGYARASSDVAYKAAIHGHKSEFRPGWVQFFKDWRPGVTDVHPVVFKLWNPEPFDRETLPGLLHTHPYFKLDLIP